MNDRVNPFNEVYVTESIGANKFVDLFSPLLVESALALYQPGHVILKGLLGTGKSMLLSLLKPDVRLSYYQEKKEFPIPRPYDRFIGSGINLRRSGIHDFAQRPINVDGFEPEELSPIFFGDFLNYWIVIDIFKSIRCLASESKLSEEIGINKEGIRLLAKSLSKNDCWYGYLEGIEDLELLEKRLKERITKYRSYLNFNSKELDSEIKETKSTIGVPIIKTVEALKKFGIVDSDTEFYVRLDQYEDLERLNNGTEIGTRYQEIVHKLLGMRDFSVSYKIGTRDFAWTKERKIIYGSNTALERKRDFNEVSIEEIFKRSENRRTLFPQFSEDIFKRRLKFSGYEDPKKEVHNYIKYTFGRSLSPSDRISRFYVRSETSKKKIIHFEENWPIEWKDFLSDLAKESLLSYKLAEAWARQKGKENIITNIPEKPYPWETKKWWKKERIEQALTQIASRNGQKLHWSGYEDIQDLSGGSILAFIFISKYIWDAWLKDNRFDIGTDNVPIISREIQSLGIERASYYWFEDINFESGGGRRKKFIRYIGNYFYNKLSSDLAMSYPGHNGFSLKKEDLESDTIINKFLRESSDYGDLDHGEHTSRSKKEGKRVKWHLSKILSPYFKIPSAHTKEPLYVDNQTVRDWLVKSEAFTDKELSSKSPKEANGQIRFNL